MTADPSDSSRPNTAPDATGHMVQTPLGPLYQGPITDAGQWVSLGVPPDAPTGVDVAATEDAGTVVTIDMSYLYQRRLEQLVAAGLPLPDGITVQDVTGWRAQHPDYDPDKPLGGQPIPAGVDIAVGTDLELPTGSGPSAECAAATGTPVEETSSKRCRVHPDGAHRCRGASNHQRTEHAGQTVTPGRSWADHVCHCGYVWCSIDGGMAGLSQRLSQASTAGADRALARVLHKLAVVGDAAGRTSVLDFRELVRDVADEIGI